MKDETKIERILEAIEKISSLPKNSKKVIIVLLKERSSLSIREIAKLCGFSHPHACSVIKRLLKQELIVKASTIYAATHCIINAKWGKGVLGTYSKTYNK